MTKKIEFPNPRGPKWEGDLELDESEVVWSATSSSVSDNQSDSISPHSLSPPAGFNNNNRGYIPKSGLSAALVEGTPTALVRRRSSLNPSSAARLIPPLVPNHPVTTRFPSSAPVNVPIWPRKEVRVFDDVDDDINEREGEEMVPPHIMVARSHVTTFSVFEGVGRTLKGRDLRSVRNAVFQKTGFID